MNMKIKKLKLASVMVLGTVVLASCSNPFDQLADEINSYLAGGDGTEEPAEVDEAADMPEEEAVPEETEDRKSTRLNSSHVAISYAVFCLKKKKKKNTDNCRTTVQRES